jgi:hypothetical protein
LTDLSQQSPSVLLIATRDPRGQLTGRKTVLRSTVLALSALGCRVTVAYFGRPAGRPDAEREGNVTYVRLPLPGHLELISTILSGFPSGRRSLNESLYASRSAHRTLARLAKEQNIEVVVTDMVRTADFGRTLGLPWIADLDDLLSLRYARLNEGGGGSRWDSLLGSMGSPFLVFLCRAGQPFARQILGQEARILARREEEVAKEAEVVSTMSPKEASDLAARTGAKVRVTPIIVEATRVDTPLPATGERARELVFLGSLDYFPNRESVVEFDRTIYPALVREGIADLALDVIGTASEAAAQDLSQRVRLLGYAEDLDDVLRRYKAMLITRGLKGGIKTKAIHAAANGVIILAHPDALEGIELVHDVSALVWRDPAELAAQLRRIRAGASRLAEISRRAREWANERYSAEMARQWWRDSLAAALAMHERSAGQAGGRK